MYREKVQELQSEIINEISFKSTTLLENKETYIKLRSAFRLDRTIDIYDYYGVESLTIIGLGLFDTEDMVCFVTENSQYLRLVEADIYQLAWVLDQIISKNIRVEETEYPF